jgi:hypothetical protein
MIDQFNVGDTLELYWYATGKWEKVNYRGKIDRNKLVVIKDHRQMVVDLHDIRPVEQQKD